jgi:leucyl aminopeptidase
MKFIITSACIDTQKTACFIAGVYDNRQLSPSAAALNTLSQGFLSTVLNQGDLDGKPGQTLLLHAVPHVCEWAQRVLLVACGPEQTLNDNQYREILRNTIVFLKTTGATEAMCTLTELNVKNRDIHWKIRQIVEIFIEAQYQFVDFKSKPEPNGSVLGLITLKVSEPEHKTAEAALLEGLAIAHGVQKTKDLGNTPPNICTPSFLAKEALALANTFPSIQTQILEKTELEALNMGALLSVGQGSMHPPKLIIMEYRGQNHQNKQPIVLVGKGITFDTGGNSLKLPINMIGMKYDMSGGGAVLGTLQAIAELKLPLHVIGIIPTAENMPGSKATRPEDIVTTASGQTVEILNTDAEGRLILCDALHYCTRFNPEVVIDIATLTASCMMALGKYPSGLFTNYQPLGQALLQAGNYSGDRCWELPLWEDYQENLASSVADMANISSVPEGGAISAACFLARFTQNFHWAHLDVAGTASTRSTGKDKAATGRPVSLLVQYLLDRTKTETNHAG